MCALSKATAINDFFTRVEKKTSEDNSKPIDFDKLAKKSGLKEDSLSQEERDYVANHLAGHTQKQQFNSASSSTRKKYNYDSPELKPQEGDDFPEFKPKLDMFKVAAHVGITDTVIPLPRLSFFPAAAMRPRSYGVTEPVLKYVSKAMSFNPNKKESDSDYKEDHGITGIIRDLNTDVLKAQREVYKVHRDYSADKYNYTINYILLKNLTGTLSQNDLEFIDKWFITSGYSQKI